MDHAVRRHTGVVAEIASLRVCDVLGFYSPIGFATGDGELRETGENICCSCQYRRGHQNQSHPEHREVFRVKVGKENGMPKHEVALVNKESGQ